MRRLPFENDVAFFLLQFYIASKPVCADGRAMLASLERTLAAASVKALAGGKPVFRPKIIIKPSPMT